MMDRVSVYVQLLQRCERVEHTSGQISQLIVVLGSSHIGVEVIVVIKLLQTQNIIWDDMMD